MSAPRARHVLKDFLGKTPWAPEAYQRWLASGRPPSDGYQADRLARALPAWTAQARAARARSVPEPARRVLVFGCLRWWMEYSVALGLLLAGLGHEVDLAYLPFRRWHTRVSDFDARRQQAYLRRLLRPLEGVLRPVDLLAHPTRPLPPDLERELRSLSLIDVQYTLQREMLDLQRDEEAAALYRLRNARNSRAAGAALQLLDRGRYDVVIVPNGSILEFGAFYRVARHLDLPVVTYEFGEQRERMWLARDDEVMHLDTTPLWEARGAVPLTEHELEALQALYHARRGGRMWENFARQWQSGESQGAQAVRRQLGLDPARPLALICTNVVGDSLALNRQLFTEGMADWLSRTVRFLAGHPEVQVVVRVHPGEMLGAGHPSVEIVRSALPEMPEHVILIPPESRVNTYDLIELAHVGLVYTTTVGMEMAMSAVPVVVAGATHYRGKGFTHDPETWPEYVQTLDRLLAEPPGRRLPAAQVERAWRYAHRFFFEYPFPFPWHLLHFWEDIEARPLEDVLRPQGLARYERTLRTLVGHPIDWCERAALGAQPEVVP